MGLSRRFADSPGPFLRAENSATISGFPHDLLSRSLGWMRGSRASRSGRRALGCTTTAPGLAPGTLSHRGAGQSAFLHSEGGVLAERRVLTLHLRSFVQIRQKPHSVPPFNQRWTRWSHLRRRAGRIPTSSTGTQPSSRRRSGSLPGDGRVPRGHRKQC